MEFACGTRAERIARKDFLLLRRVAEQLGCAYDEVVEAAGRAVSERDARFKEYRALLQRLAEADAALQAGRACLHAFQRQVLVQRSIRTLQDLLTRANACYAEYLRALDLADQQARYILWYLSEMREDAIEEAGATQRPARHVA